MRFSTHYYVLSLSRTTNALFEAFRDSLIEVENHGFPLSGASYEPVTTGRKTLQELARAVDRLFDHYYAPEPLGVVVVGPPEMQLAFSSVTAHATAVIGRIEGDHTGTSTRDLGQIVWPLVKEAMSGVLDRALRDLEDSSTHGRVASGLDEVVVAAGEEVAATLLVEDEFHRRGSVRQAEGLPVMTADVDVREVMDDVVDAVIEKVLESSGNVLFTPPGFLRDQEQIALLRRSARRS